MHGAGGAQGRHNRVLWFTVYTGSYIHFLHFQLKGVCTKWKWKGGRSNLEASKGWRRSVPSLVQKGCTMVTNGRSLWPSGYIKFWKIMEIKDSSSKLNNFLENLSDICSDVMMFCMCTHLVPGIGLGMPYECGPDCLTGDRSGPWQHAIWLGAY